MRVKHAPSTRGNTKGKCVGFPLAELVKSPNEEEICSKLKKKENLMAAVEKKRIFCGCHFIKKKNPR